MSPEVSTRFGPTMVTAFGGRKVISGTEKLNRGGGGGDGVGGTGPGGVVGGDALLLFNMLFRKSSMMVVLTTRSTGFGGASFLATTRERGQS